jgi:hypothetical protein
LRLQTIPVNSGVPHPITQPEQFAAAVTDRWRPGVAAKSAEQSFFHFLSDTRVSFF